MLDMCLKVAEGKKFLGFETKKSDTLYLALEDGDSFEQERLNIVLGGREAPQNFHFVFSNVMPMLKARRKNDEKTA
ncbi:MAG: AAA family ATPase, partial [Erysipelotrichaceae bacterium]|nr:AAA family ATPase [Erysipelotrichaceae bacterium]